MGECCSGRKCLSGQGRRSKHLEHDSMREEIRGLYRKRMMTAGSDKEAD